MEINDNIDRKTGIDIVSTISSRCSPRTFGIDRKDGVGLYATSMKSCLARDWLEGLFEKFQNVGTDDRFLGDALQSRPGEETSFFRTWFSNWRRWHWTGTGVGGRSGNRLLWQSLWLVMNLRITKFFEVKLKF